MEIIDAQIHEPEPVAEWNHGEESRLALCVELAREAMDCVGVDAALLNATDRFCAAAVTRYPDRFSACTLLDPNDPELDERAARYRDRPGFKATRVLLRDWRTGRLHADFTEGRLEPFFSAAEKSGLPVFLSASGHPPAVALIAERHPDLQLIVDHLGLAQQPGPVPENPWALLQEVNALARFPNVAIKLCGANTLSKRPFPHEDVWPHLIPMVEAFTPQRVMWASDFTRLRMPIGQIKRGPRAEWFGTYADSLSFIRDTSELSDTDKAHIFGGTIRRILRW